MNKTGGHKTAVTPDLAGNGLLCLLCRLWLYSLMDEQKLRAWWWRWQGLDGSLRGKTPKEVLDQSGWARAVGGSGPYLTLFSRAGTDRKEVNDAQTRLEIHELPAARGCTYVVPAGEFALALRVGADFVNAEMKVA